ncbi:MAG: sulfatase-like hydrolase/transferase [Lachnospiraceae bacterium]|nr:sulfatase-like hydrolase/transferase [Lachnospiraceae bacterium]
MSRKESSISEINTEKKASYPLTALGLTIFFGLSFFYMELVFKFSVSARVLDASVLRMLAVSFITGSFIAFLVYMLPHVLARITAALALLVSTVSFLIEFFIQREFSVFYDINTILNAATDALKGFAGDIRELIFCFDGISHILLFLVPSVAWIIFGRRLVKGIKRTRMIEMSYPVPEKVKGIEMIDLSETEDEDETEKTMEQPCGGPLSNRGRRFIAGLIPAGVLLLAVSSLFIMSYAGVIDREKLGPRYSFQNSVVDLGLAGSVALDVKNIGNSGVTESEFVIVDYTDPLGDVPVPVTPDVSVSGNDDVTVTAAEPVVYGVNAYDIDFAGLAEAGGAFSNMNAYVASLTPSSKNEYTGLFEGKNLIVFCAEAFSSSIIDPDLTPALYRLTTKGINFTDYYEQATAGTTGGEFELIYGLMPLAGGDSMLTMTAQGSYTNMGAMLSSDMGYYGMAFHDNDDLYYSRNITHNLLGYSEGFMGFGNGMEKLISRAWPESDLEMMQGTLPLYTDHQPFNIYYMTVSGHSGYNFSSNAMSVRNRERVEEWCAEKGLEYTEPVKAYIACQLELEKALEYTLEYLEENDLADDTVIALAPDHFPYGLTNGGYLGNLPYLDELYGYKVETQLDRDKNTAIIWCGVLEDMDPIIIDKPTSPLDILPTLLNLFGCEWDSRLYIGRDVLSDAEGLYFDSGYNWKTEVGSYRAATGTFTPNPGYEEVGEAYIKRHNAIVANKIAFNRNVIYNAYFPYVYSLLAQQAAEEAGDGTEETVP